VQPEIRVKLVAKCSNQAISFKCVPANPSQ
jgi:hypothetical protein